MTDLRTIYVDLNIFLLPGLLFTYSFRTYGFEKFLSIFLSKGRGGSGVRLKYKLHKIGNNDDSNNNDDQDYGNDGDDCNGDENDINNDTDDRNDNDNARKCSAPHTQKQKIKYQIPKTFLLKYPRGDNQESVFLKEPSNCSRLMDLQEHSSRAQRITERGRMRSGVWAGKGGG